MQTVQLILDLPAEQYAYISMLAVEAGLTLEQFVLEWLPHPEDMTADQTRQAEEIMDRNQKVLKKLS